MAEVTRRRTGEFLRLLFDVLLAAPEGMQAKDAIQAVRQQVALTDYESGDYEKSGGNRFVRILRFATVDCVKAGWLSKHKGIWTVTESGQEAYRKFADPEKFYSEAVRLYRSWKKEQTATGDDTPPDIQEDAENSATITFEQAEEQAWAEIAGHVQSLPPYVFQEIVAHLLVAMGYHIDWVAPPGADGGADIVAYRDPLGTQPPRIKVQVKRYKQDNKIDVDTLRAFVATVENDEVGIFVTSGVFTKGAEAFARYSTSRKITLINIEKFVDLWVQFYSSLPEEARQHFPVTPIHFLTPRR